EWCYDWYDSYTSSPQTNPTGPTSGSYRVPRGGGWGGSAKYCRVAYRYDCNPDYRNYYLGLRVVCEIENNEAINVSKNGTSTAEPSTTSTSSLKQLEVISFELLPNDLTAHLLGTKRVDYNGEDAALIKIETTVKGLYFDGGMIGLVGDPEYKTGEIWLYVPGRAKKITIKHPTLGVIRDYYYPTPIQSGKTYRMKLNL
ncbi:MAG: SUMF1/EgtB/PvdO family nonheme iron enzyme, partial [Muribaculaceae bacterium]|nr:SUMF1/EgtB/PvdO family nonheme iron enzyme [Muribaculaceae bacterium]